MGLKDLKSKAAAVALMAAGAFGSKQVEAAPQDLFAELDQKTAVMDLVGATQMTIDTDGNGNAVIRHNGKRDLTHEEEQALFQEPTQVQEVNVQEVDLDAAPTLGAEEPVQEVSVADGCEVSMTGYDLKVHAREALAVQLGHALEVSECNPLKGMSLSEVSTIAEQAMQMPSDAPVAITAEMTVTIDDPEFQAFKDAQKFQEAERELEQMKESMGIER